MRKQASSITDITFSIVKLIDKANKNTSIYFKINDKLSDFNNDNFKRPVQRISESDTRRETSTDGRQEQHTTKMDESAKSPNFFRDNKSNKPERKYTTTRIKSRNFLSNILYEIFFKFLTTNK